VIRRTAIASILLVLAATAYADTQNVRKWQSQVQFRPAAAAGASGGASANRAPASGEKESLFRHLDIDGDGFVSKAEAAGNAPVTVGFDRADRNRDGKLSLAEYDSIGKPQPARKKATRSQRAQTPASAGATKKTD
jgi:EF hand/EF-hand domain pair